MPVFSFRWSLPPILGCIPKQPDSLKAHRQRWAVPQTGLSPSATCRSKQLRHTDPPGKCFSRLQLTDASIGDFKFELFPLHSPLLKMNCLKVNRLFASATGAAGTRPTREGLPILFSLRWCAAGWTTIVASLSALQGPRPQRSAHGCDASTPQASARQVRPCDG